MYFTLLILSKIILISAIWPPPYKVDLNQSEEFIIGDYFKNSEDLFDPEDEMIEDEEIKTFNLDKDKHKFHLLHKQSKRFNDKTDENKNYLKDTTDLIVEQNETYYNEYDAEFEPFQAGFVDEKNQFILNQENKNVYYYNKITKQLESSYIKQKREDQKGNDYNYAELNKEYQIEIDKEIKLKETFNATNVQDHESVKEAVDKMVDFKSMPKNCTEEEMKGIGFQAIKCAWIDLKKSKTKEARLKLLYKVKKIFLIWFSIYLVIAVPLWCHKGWCCCCFRCKICKPRKVLDEAKKYYVESPPGVYLADNGYTITYEPNIYEIDAYRKLEKALMTL